MGCDGGQGCDGWGVGRAVRVAVGSVQCSGLRDVSGLCVRVCLVVNQYFSAVGGRPVGVLHSKW